MSPRVIAALMAYPWPGNIRELENVIRRLVLLGESTTIIALSSGAKARADAVPSTAAGVEGLRKVARRGAQAALRTVLIEVLDQVGWNRVAAARVLKVSYKTLRNKIAECELTPPAARKPRARAWPAIPTQSDQDTSFAH